jgi:protein O-mannosyl-transferase
MFNKMNLGSREQKLIIYFVLAVVTFAVFWQVNQFDFVNLDDDVYITDNSHIRSGIMPDGLHWAFCTTYAEFWHPLTWLSLIFDYQLYGLNAGGYHLTSLILHILSTLLLFRLFNRMTGTVWKSAFVAALFALHPLHVESVAWISERKDVLSTFFWMLTLSLYVYYTEKPAIIRYLLVLFSFALALMSKSMVVTLPLIIILLDYWPLGRFKSKKGNFLLWQLREKTIFFVLSGFFVIITLIAQQNTAKTIFPLGSRLANSAVSFVIYLEKTFWPYNLTVFYPFPEHIPLWQVLGSILLIIMISAPVVLMAKRLPYLFTGWLWYIITILPVIGIIQVGNHAMADRYTYLPSVGIGVMLAWGLPLLFQSENSSKKILLPVSITAIAIMAVLAWQQCGYWKNNISLYKHALLVTKNNELAHHNLATALSKEGKLHEAIDHYNEAIHINPYIAESYFNRGTAYHGIGQYQLAIDDLSKAIRFAPDYANAYNNRAFVYLNHGDKISGCRDAKKACETGNCNSLKYAKAKGLCR